MEEEEEEGTTIWFAPQDYGNKAEALSFMSRVEKFFWPTFGANGLLIA